MVWWIRAHLHAKLTDHLLRAVIRSHGSAADVVPGQQRLDIWPWGERWNDVAEGVLVGTEILEDFFQVLLFFVGTLYISLFVLLGDDEDIHHKAVPHPVKNALAYCLLQAVQALQARVQAIL